MMNETRNICRQVVHTAFKMLWCYYSCTLFLYFYVWNLGGTLNYKKMMTYKRMQNMGSIMQCPSYMQRLCTVHPTWDQTAFSAFEILSLIYRVLLTHFAVQEKGLVKICPASTGGTVSFSCRMYSFLQRKVLFEKRGMVLASSKAAAFRMSAKKEFTIDLTWSIF